MGQKTVGIQELRSHLSSHIRELRNGATLVITHRGKPVARILPIVKPEGTLEEKLHQLVEAGIASWSGQKLSPKVPSVPVRGPKTVSELLIEDRD